MVWFLGGCVVTVYCLGFVVVLSSALAARDLATVNRIDLGRCVALKCVAIATFWPAFIVLWLFREFRTG